MAAILENGAVCKLHTLLTTSLRSSEIPSVTPMTDFSHADQSCTRVGSGRPAGRVGSGPVRWVTKCIVKFCDACHIIHYNNEFKKFYVVFYVYGDQAMWQIRSKSYKCGFGINACLSPAQHCLKCLIAAWACRPLLCCLRSKMRGRNPSCRIAIAHRTSCACNKTTNVYGNHSDCLCLLYL